MKCPKCNGERIEARQCGLQSMMDVCEYDMTCRDCGHGWRGERGLRVYSPDERKEWANVTFVDREVYGTPVLVSVIDEIRNAQEGNELRGYVPVLRGRTGGEEEAMKKRKVVSLHGLIEVERIEVPPPIVYMIVPEGMGTGTDGVPEMKGNLEGFVRLKALPPEMQSMLLKVVSNTSTKEQIIAGMSEATRNELKSKEAQNAVLGDEP